MYIYIYEYIYDVVQLGGIYIHIYIIYRYILMGDSHVIMEVFFFLLFIR
jgi:hypothetical protein